MSPSFSRARAATSRSWGTTATTRARCCTRCPTRRAPRPACGRARATPVGECFALAALAAYFTSPLLQRTVRRHRVVRVVRSRWLAEQTLSRPAAEIFGDIRRQQRDELLTRCLPALLRYDDRTAGALGMETRLPLLDYRVVEFAYRLPLNHKIRGGWTKYLLRRYLARHGLEAVAWRRGKYAFYAPQAAWTRRLIEARGATLDASPFTRALLEDGLSLAQRAATHGLGRVQLRARGVGAGVATRRVRRRGDRRRRSTVRPAGHRSGSGLTCAHRPLQAHETSSARSPLRLPPR